MAVTYIKVDVSKRLGADLRQTVVHGAEFDERLHRLKEVMDTMIDGTDYSRIETEFGLVAGQGQTVYNLVAGAAAGTAATDIHQLLVRLG
jgi:uncharacterized protein YecE (DUF72 family)